MFRKRKGQSTLEYVVVITAIIATIIAVVATTIGKKDKGAGLGKLMYQTGERIKTESGKIADMVK